MTESPRCVHVDLGPRSYDVHIGSGVRDRLGEFVASLGAKQAVVISETNVAPLYMQAIGESLHAADLTTWGMQFPAGESNKTLATVSQCLDKLLTHETPIDRQTVIVALGGGVAGDLSGFVAACALRGLRWVQVPTSLLADVDASVGGKTGVDHEAGKNLIGAFHQPAGVLIDVDTLRTLPLAELRNGLAECVKHGVIRDVSLLAFLEQHATNLLTDMEFNGEYTLQFDPATMTELVARNVAIKAAVVSEDETEAGVRALLNFGHTVGHGVEAYVVYDQLRHGEAVSLGMIAANHIAVARGLLPASDAARVESLLLALGLPVRIADLDIDAVWQIMQRDKKALAGKVRFVLATALGQAALYDDISEAEVRAAIAALAT